MQFWLHMACLTGELGVAACTLVHLFSLNASSEAIGIDKGKIRAEKTFSFVSLVSTLGALVVMVIGAATIQRSMLQAWQSVRMSAASINRRVSRVSSSRNNGTAGRRGTSVAVPDHS